MDSQTLAPQPPDAPADWRIEALHTAEQIAAIAGIVVLSALGKIPGELAGTFITAIFAGVKAMRQVNKNRSKKAGEKQPDPVQP